MKKIFKFKHLAAIGIIALMTLSSCGVTVRDHPSNSNNGYYNSNIRSHKNRIERNERRINELRNSQHRDKVAIIEIRHNKVKSQVNEFNGKTSKEWKSFKKEVNKDIKAVGKSLKKITKKRK
jgi:hypothetical protein